MRFLNISLLLFLMLVVVWVQAADIKGAFVVIDDEASIKDVLQKITSGSGKKELEKKDVYKDDNDGKAALRINVAGGDGQNFNPNMPDWELEIEKKPVGKNQFRYITFAWEVHTRDLIEDWKDLAKGGQIITGIAFTAWDGKAGLFDHVAFHQTPEDPLAPQAVDAKAKLTVKWAEIKH